MKLIEILAAIVSIFIALYNFDPYDFNRCIVSILLILTAILVLSPYPKLNRYVRSTAVFLTVFLIMKLLITG